MKASEWEKECDGDTQPWVHEIIADLAACEKERDTEGARLASAVAFGNMQTKRAEQAEHDAERWKQACASHVEYRKKLEALLQEAVHWIKDSHDGCDEKCEARALLARIAAQPTAQTPSLEEAEDIAGEVWDFLTPYLPLGNRTDLYDRMRKRFPEPSHPAGQDGFLIPSGCTCKWLSSYHEFYQYNPSCAFHGPLTATATQPPIDFVTGLSEAEAERLGPPDRARRWRCMCSSWTEQPNGGVCHICGGPVVETEEGKA